MWGYKGKNQDNWVSVIGVSSKYKEWKGLPNIWTASVVKCARLVFRAVTCPSLGLFKQKCICLFLKSAVERMPVMNMVVTWFTNVMVMKVTNISGLFRSVKEFWLFSTKEDKGNKKGEDVKCNYVYKIPLCGLHREAKRMQHDLDFSNYFFVCLFKLLENSYCNSNETVSTSEDF